MSDANSKVPLQDVINISWKNFQDRKFNESLAIAQNILKQVDNFSAKYIAAANLVELGDLVQAEQLLLNCLNQDSKNIDVLFTLGRIANINNKNELAIQYYEKVLSINPDYTAALNNIGNMYNDCGRNQDALNMFNRLIQLGVNEHYVYNNIGLIYRKLGFKQEALDYTLKAIELKPDYGFEPYQNVALIYESIARSEDAIKYYESALKFAPERIQLLVDYRNVLSKVCDWERHAQIDQRIKQVIESGGAKDYHESPMCNVQRIIDPKINMEVARQFMQKPIQNMLVKFEQFTFQNRMPKQKLRIGYISADIKDHPVAQLMAGVFEYHNKEEFEVYLYSHNHEDNSGYKERIHNCCDKVINTQGVDNRSLAQAIYNDEIDVLIDLSGHTEGSRVETLVLKPAPVQVNYIGFIGTMGVDAIDYIITDKIVTPPDQQQYYAEKFMYMPNCYQANDDKLKISDQELTRKDFGLPDDKFVFCSFNQSAKIEPIMFDSWMNILKAVPDSVLWLYKGSIYKDYHLAADNIRRQAVKRGVASERIIFADAIHLDKHLKRLALADLALDTRIYNGGTITSQTLWAGLPVLTLQGGHFASRMASSILNAVGMEELVARTAKEYEEKAIEAATIPGRSKQLKEKLTQNKKTHPLFNTKQFTSDMESAYKAMWSNYVEGNVAKTMIAA